MWNATTGQCEGNLPDAPHGCNLVDSDGRYCVAYVDRTGTPSVVFQRSDFGDATFVLTRTVAAGDRPWLWYDWQIDRLYCLFDVGGDLKESYSDDEGDTWSTPAVSIAGAKHGAAASHPHTGEILRLGRKSADGTIIGTYAENPNATPSAVFTCKTSTGASLVADDDSMSLALDPLTDRWWLRITQAGALVDWFSDSEGQGTRGWTQA